MVTETTNIDDLLPDRYPQHDLFICDVADAVLKDVMAEMEHPFYALSKKPERRIRRYEHNGQWLEITPSVKGQATIYDKDILIYCISQIVAKLKVREPVNRRVRISSHELLRFTNRGTSGRDYMALSEALDRLAGTLVSTNIRIGDEEELTKFHLIDTATLRRKHGLDGRLLWCEVTLSDWVFDAIRANDVLTLHRDYFRLRKPLERRVYELARKHCGQQEMWAVSLGLLLKKSGAQSPLKRFRQMIKKMAEVDHLPDYTVEFDEDNAKVIFRNRAKWWREQNPVPALNTVPPLATWAYEKAKAVAPGVDVYAIEQDFRTWIGDKKPPRKGYEVAFVGFCKKKANQR